MYKVRRMISYDAVISDDWSTYSAKVSNKEILLSDKDMLKLKEISNNNEYDYIDFPFSIILDCAPHVIDDNIDNKEFLQEYESHLGDKFFVAFYYIRDDDNE